MPSYSFFFQVYENKLKSFEREEMANLQLKTTALNQECDNDDSKKLNLIIQGN